MLGNTQRVGDFILLLDVLNKPNEFKSRQSLSPYLVIGPSTDRKSVVQGKSVDLGGRRIIKKKKEKKRKKEKKKKKEKERI